MSVAERLARYWTATNCQGEYLYSSLDLREDTAAELRRLTAEVEALRDALRLYVHAGFGDSTDHFKQGEAYDAAVEVLGHKW